MVHMSLRRLWQSPVWIYSEKGTTQTGLKYDEALKSRIKSKTMIGGAFSFSVTFFERADTQKKLDSYNTYKRTHWTITKSQERTTQQTEKGGEGSKTEWKGVWKIFRMQKAKTWLGRRVALKKIFNVYSTNGLAIWMGLVRGQEGNTSVPRFSSQLSLFIR
jgi:hypothetical protein